MLDGLRRLDDAGTARRVLERLREGVYVSTPAGEILDANPAFLAILGARTLEELRASNAGDWLAEPAQRERWKASLDSLGSVVDFELKVRRRDGEIRVVLDTAWTRVDPESGDVYYHGILTDVTDRKELEAALDEQALRDPITGCYNRRYLAQAAREEPPRGCVVVEVDRAQAEGALPEDGSPDPVANRISRFLMRQSRAETTLVRMHSNEFLLLLRDADGNAVANVIERLVFAATRETLPPFTVGGSARDEAEPLTEAIRRARENRTEVPSAAGPGRKPSGIYPLP
ncbi:MAG TPA: PAS domain S-box protein [Thermoanaerobaculia bacterium]|nr:PAS domain S-box protein [Thermoanaerobaculia bacterium]